MKTINNSNIDYTDEARSESDWFIPFDARIKSQIAKRQPQLLKTHIPPTPNWLWWRNFVRINTPGTHRLSINSNGDCSIKINDDVYTAFGGEPKTVEFTIYQPGWYQVYVSYRANDPACLREYSIMVCHM